MTRHLRTLQFVTAAGGKRLQAHADCTNQQDHHEDSLAATFAKYRMHPSNIAQTRRANNRLRHCTTWEPFLKGQYGLSASLSCHGQGCAIPKPCGVGLCKVTIHAEMNDSKE